MRVVDDIQLPIGTGVVKNNKEVMWFLMFRTIAVVLAVIVS